MPLLLLLNKVARYALFIRNGKIILERNLALYFQIIASQCKASIGGRTHMMQCGLRSCNTLNGIEIRSNCG